MNQPTQVTDTANFNAKVRSHPVFRVLAILCVALIVALIICTLVTGITGSKLFLPFLALTILTPMFLYVFLWIARLASNLHDAKLEKMTTPPEDSE